MEKTKKEAIVTTNQIRLAFLHERLQLLQNKIVQADLEDEYVKLVSAVAEGTKKISPVTETDFDLMLPKEQENNLLAHYHTMRAELYTMRQEGKEKSYTNKLQGWLENPWVKIGLTTLTLTQLAVKLVEIAGNSGLFFQEEDDTEYLDV